MEDTDTRSSSGPDSRAATGRPYLMVIAGGRVGELHKLTRERTVVGRSPSAELRLDDDGISREHAELVVIGGRVRVRDLGSTNGTTCNGERVDVRELRDGDKVSIGGATLLVFTHDDSLEGGFARGRSGVALRDPVTSAMRRDVFAERLAEEVSFSRRHAAPLALLVWELDAFAAAEDRHGPAAMRLLLAAVAGRAREALRDDDLLAVVGAGRFAVACPETSAEEARERAEGLRRAMAAAPVEVATSRLSVTVSVGVALSEPSSDRGAAAAAKLVRTAETALAAAGLRGGDCVELAARASSS